MTIGDGPHNGGVPPGASATRTATGTARINDVLGAVQKLRHGQQQVPVTYAPSPGGQAVPKMHWTRSGFAALPGSEAAYEGLAQVSRALGRVAGTLTFYAQAVDQWGRDVEEFEDDPVARGTRSVYRAGVVTGAGVAGGKAGSAIGTVLTTSAASAWSAFLSGDRLLWFVREAHAYLRKPDTAGAVRATVQKALAETGATVIAHSLGSVVFYDMLSRDEIPTIADGSPPVTTLVTCGSPLRWLAVRKGVHTTGGPLGVPAGIRWTNLYSPLDVVPRGKGLADLADGVTDVMVHNGALKPHDVERYLDKPVIAECLTRARTV
ncbi:hypothetical protein ABZ864_25375 [Streptomyces sp. NPDC047082]|uniref:hypothetical protein n=1 Tax=Streptomyces sp. NPDC047082 TaxID=3155259 RepID=UPI003403087E